MTTIKRKGNIGIARKGDELKVTSTIHVEEVTKELMSLMMGEVTVEIADNQTAIEEFQK